MFISYVCLSSTHDNGSFCYLDRKFVLCRIYSNQPSRNQNSNNQCLAACWFEIDLKFLLGLPFLAIVRSLELQIEKIYQYYCSALVLFHHVLLLQALHWLCIGFNMGIFSLQGRWLPDSGRRCEWKMKIRWCWSLASISNKTTPLANGIDLEKKKAGNECWAAALLFFPQ